MDRPRTPPMLRFLGVDGKDVSELNEMNRRMQAHPLGADSTSQFFKALVQKLWQNGKYFDDHAEIKEPPGPYIYRKPMLLLGRSAQGPEAIGRYLDVLPTMPELPEALLRIVGVETGREAASWGA